jgi:hypothetical protein
MKISNHNNKNISTNHHWHAYISTIRITNIGFMLSRNQKVRVMRNYAVRTKVRWDELAVPTLNID